VIPSASVQVSQKEVMKVNYFPHQMAITLAENGSLVKNQKS